MAQAVIRLTADPDISVSELSRAVSADIGLSAKIVKKANSAFYAGTTRVSSLPLAIVKLGFPSTRSLAIAGSVEAMFRQGDDAGFEQYLWRHSLAVGIASRIIVRHVEPALTEDAFLAGLLHDIAKLVLLQRFPSMYTPILIEARESQSPLIEIESTKMGFTHADLGAMILDRWNFAETETRAVRFHHDPSHAGLTAEDAAVEHDSAQVAHTICLADALVKNFEAGSTPAADSKFTDNPGFGYLGLSETQMDQVCQELSNQMGDELQIFGQPETSIF